MDGIIDRDLAIAKMEWQREKSEMKIIERERCKKFGKSYKEVFKTNHIHIPTPNNRQSDFGFDSIFYRGGGVSICYLCSSIIALQSNGTYDTAYHRSDAHSKLYKPHFACLDCHKSWKPTCRPAAVSFEFCSIESDISAATRCSSCGKLGTYMGLNFRSPRKKDHKGWENVKKIIAVDPQAFEAKCKCK